MKPLIKCGFENRLETKKYRKFSNKFSPYIAILKSFILSQYTGERYEVLAYNSKIFWAFILVLPLRHIMTYKMPET